MRPTNAHDICCRYDEWEQSHATLNAYLESGLGAMILDDVEPDGIWYYLHEAGKRHNQDNNDLYCELGACVSFEDWLSEEADQGRWYEDPVGNEVHKNIKHWFAIFADLDENLSSWTLSLADLNRVPVGQVSAASAKNCHGNFSS